MPVSVGGIRRALVENPVTCVTAAVDAVGVAVVTQPMSAVHCEHVAVRLDIENGAHRVATLSEIAAAGAHNAFGPVVPDVQQEQRVLGIERLPGVCRQLSRRHGATTVAALALRYPTPAP